MRRRRVRDRELRGGEPHNADDGPGGAETRRDEEREVVERGRGAVAAADVQRKYDCGGGGGARLAVVTAQHQHGERRYGRRAMPR